MSEGRLSTGVDGLDTILDGGLVPGRSYLVRGDPGSGKTILGTHFLVEGVENGETALFVKTDDRSARHPLGSARLDRRTTGR